jgi:hypothetical protein
VVLATEGFGVHLAKPDCYAAFEFGKGPRLQPLRATSTSCHVCFLLNFQQKPQALLASIHRGRSNGKLWRSHDRSSTAAVRTRFGGRLLESSNAFLRLLKRHRCQHHAVLGCAGVGRRCSSRLGCFGSTPAQSGRARCFTTFQRGHGSPGTSFTTGTCTFRIPGQAPANQQGHVIGTL